MKTNAVSKFKATCLALLDRVLKTGQPILITRQGKPLAQVLPPPAPVRNKSWLGSRKGTAQIKGDIIKPAVSPGDWT